MKRRNGILGVSSLIATMLVPTVVQADMPFTRQTHDNIIMYDDGETVQAYSRTYGSTKEGVVDVDRLSKELKQEDALRVTKSRINIEIPKNTFCDGTDFNPYCDGATKEQDVFPDGEVAQKWIASFFTPRAVFDIEADLAILMEEHEATRAFYHFNDTVRVRNRSAPANAEDRLVTYTIMLNKNQYPGQGLKQGIAISNAEFTTNLYVVYRNSNSSDLLDDRISVDGSGELIVYEMSGLTPEDSVLTEVERVANPSFDTERLVNKRPNFEYETNGVKNVLLLANEYKKQFASDIVIVDYHNPVTVTKCPVDTDGSCLPNDQNKIESPALAPKMNVFTTGRTFFRNVCTGEGVVYNQSNHIQAETEEYIERYILTPDDNIRPNMTDSELLALERFAPFNFDRHGLLEEDFDTNHTFNYNTNISFFNTNITDYLGKNGSTPNNAFTPICEGYSTYENDSCYDVNGLHHEHYLNDSYAIPAVEDISIVDVNYEERVKTADAYSYEDEDGNTVNVPAQYEWQKKNTCNTAGGTRIYNVSDFCSDSNIKCLSVDRK